MAPVREVSKKRKRMKETTVYVFYSMYSSSKNSGLASTINKATLALDFSNGFRKFFLIC